MNFLYLAPPVIQRPPPPLVTIDVGDVFNISCSALGVSKFPIKLLSE